MNKFILYISIAFVVSSCATSSSAPPENNFAKSFSYNNEILGNLSPSEGLEVIFIDPDVFYDQSLEYWTRGYDYLGSSSFNEQKGYYSFREGQIKEFGKQIGAELALYTQEYVNSSNFNISNQTVNIQFFRHYVSYLAKNINTPFYGFFMRELSNEEKSIYATNYGIKIVAVRNYSAAFESGLVPGDILLMQDDRKLVSTEDMLKLPETTFLILRSGREIKISLAKLDLNLKK